MSIFSFISPTFRYDLTADELCNTRRPTSSRYFQLVKPQQIQFSSCQTNQQRVRVLRFTIHACFNVNMADLTSPPSFSATIGTYTWTVSLPAGTNITLQVRDGTGAVNYGSPVVVQPGTSDSCVDQAAASSASAAGGGAVGGGGASSTSAASSAASSSAASGSSLVSSTGSVTSVFVYSYILLEPR